MLAFNLTEVYSLMNSHGVYIMKKVVTIISLILSALLILDTMNAGHALMMFLFAGVIPGTNSSISADTMLALFALLAGFTLSRVTAHLSRLMGHQPRLSVPSTSRA